MPWPQISILESTIFLPCWMGYDDMISKINGPPFEVKLSTLQNSLDLGADANAQAAQPLAVAVMFFVGQDTYLDFQKKPSTCVLCLDITEIKVRFFQYRQYRHQKSPWSSGHPILIARNAVLVMLQEEEAEEAAEFQEAGDFRIARIRAVLHHLASGKSWSTGGKSKKGHQILHP